MRCGPTSTNRTMNHMPLKKNSRRPPPALPARKLSANQLAAEIDRLSSMLEAGDGAVGHASRLSECRHLLRTIEAHAKSAADDTDPGPLLEK